MRPTLLAGSLTLAALALAGPVAAAPHDGECRPVRGCDGRGARSCDGVGGTLPYVVRTDVRVRGGGSSWTVLRRYLPDRAAWVREHYVRRYFLRRWPAVLTQGREAEELENLFRERAATEAPLTPGERLARATVEFYVGRYADAQAGFEQVLAAAPREPRAALGLALSSLLRHDWRATVAALGRLDGLGELRLDDRLAVEDAFGDREDWRQLRRALEGYLAYRPSDGPAQLCAAWSALLEDDARTARAHLDEGRPHAGDLPLFARLDQLLSAAPAPAPAPADPAGDAPPPPKRLDPIVASATATAAAAAR